MDPTSRRVIFVGYGPSTKFYRVYDPKRRMVEAVRDVQVNEKIPQELIFLNERWIEEAEVTTQKEVVPAPQPEGEKFYGNGEEGINSGIPRREVR